eukprot:TRINITY_DN6228_c0_g1_i14.p2 TRINITY_DN6228_c0_g1~~TRINITY_DN6228_c0_g1_i14.p2  ORF type:complete len:142 (-),score=42.60 TRINITY_DN6228_c0_g1_i14:481-906(-)
MMESASIWHFSFLSFSLAAQTASVKLGTVFDYLSLPRLYETSGGLALGYWFGMAISSICVGVAVKFSQLDRKYNYGAAGEQVSLWQVAEFPRVFWLVALCLGVFLGTYNTFNSLAAKMLQARFDFDLISTSYAIVLLSATP